MKRSAYVPRLLELTLGQFFTALGVVFMLQANLGLEPWSVLQQGLHHALGISFGTAVVVVSTSIILLDLLLGERIGLGMVFSALLCGPIIDVITALDRIPQQTKLLPGLAFLLLGLELLAFGTWLSMKVGLGCGARDALMVAMARRTGITTIVSAAGIGALIELNFRLLRYQALEEKHEYLSDTFRHLVLRR